MKEEEYTDGNKYSDEKEITEICGTCLSWVPHTHKLAFIMTNQGDIIAVAGEDSGGIKNTIVQKANGDLIVKMGSENLKNLRIKHQMFILKLCY